MGVVLCYGDSNTYGTPPMQAETDKARLARHARWPGVMAAQLGDAYQVIEEGLPGRTVCNDDQVKGPAWNGMKMLPAVLASHAPIDLLIVMLGTNDFQHRFAMTGQEVGIALMRLAEQATLYGQIKQQLFVVPPPVREEGLFAELFTGAEAREASLEGHMRRLLPPIGVDVIAAAPHATVDAIDGVHWDVASHQTFGAVMARAVAERL